MAEEEYVSYDRYCADLADFRADMARFREEVRGELANLRIDNASIRQEMARLHAQTIIWLASLVATGVALTVTLVKVIP
jgi:phage-related minor tail protein